MYHAYMEHNGQRMHLSLESTVCHVQDTLIWSFGNIDHGSCLLSCPDTAHAMMTATYRLHGRTTPSLWQECGNLDKQGSGCIIHLNIASLSFGGKSHASNGCKTYLLRSPDKRRGKTWPTWPTPSRIEFSHGPSQYDIWAWLKTKELGFHRS